MSAYRTSSLAFSNIGKKDFLKKLPTRISKQHLMEHKMFGSRRKGIQIGRKFRSPVSKGLIEPHMEGEAGGVSPSMKEFDRMMSNITKGSSHSFTRKRGLFKGKRKQFG